MVDDGQQATTVIMSNSIVVNFLAMVVDNDMHIKDWWLVFVNHQLQTVDTNP